MPPSVDVSTLGERVATVEAELRGVREALGGPDGVIATLRRVDQRVAKIDLNGHADDIKRLAESATGLVALAACAPALVEVAKAHADRQAVLAYRRRTLRPLVLLGGLIVSSIIGAIAYSVPWGSVPHPW